MDENEPFGRRMRRLRKARELTQEALAQQVFCATDTIKKLEQGLRRPSRQLAAQLADIFGLADDERAAFLAAARAVPQSDRLPPSAADLTDQHALPDTIPATLPLQHTALIGREQEVAKVCTLLDRKDVRLVTLTGPGGTGKTRLAVQVATELLDAFADGVYFVTLAPIHAPALVVETIAATLGVKEGGDQPLLALLKRYLHDRTMLLVLDNFEHLLAAASLVTELLDAAPGMKVLVTSRACLQLYGEWEFPVPSLALPNLTHMPPLEPLTQYEAVRLFIERARAVKPDFTVTNENAPAVAEICVRLDGLPLAIELAAVRVKVLTPEALLARLSRRLHLLTGGARNLPVRQQTLRDTIAWSHDLLPRAEQALFARLAVFVGGCTLEAIAAICNVAGDGVDMLDSLQTLVNNSLLRQEGDTNGEPRLQMLETIREFAHEQLVARGEETAQRARHAEYYLALAEDAQPRLNTGEQEVWLEQLEAEHDNLRAALAWTIERGDGDQAVRLAAALWHFWEMRGYFTEGRRWLEAALERGQGAAAAARAEAYTGAGTMAWRQCDYAQAMIWHQHALDLYRSVGDTYGIAFALNNLGMQSLDQGDLQAALQRFSESLALSQQFGHTRMSAGTLHNLGELARHQGDNERAVDCYTQSLALCRALGDQWLSCYSLTGLGTVAGYQGNDAQATLFLKEALTLCHEQGYQELIVECLEGLAGCAARQRQGVRAARLFGVAEQLRDMMNTPRAPVEDQWFAKATALAQGVLDPTTYKQAWMDGRRMSLAEAIAYALNADE